MCPHFTTLSEWWLLGCLHYTSNTRTPKEFLWGENWKAIPQKASKKLSWRKLRLLLTLLYFSFILYYIWCRSQWLENSHCDAYGFQSLNVAQDAFHASTIQPPSCNHHVGICPFTSWLHHVPWSGRQWPLPIVRTSRTMPRVSRTTEAPTPYRARAWRANCSAQGLKAALLMHVLSPRLSW